MKLLAGLSLVGLLLGAAFLLLAQVEQAERALEPGATLAETETSRSPGLSPTQGARGAAVAQSASYLLDTLELDYLSSGRAISKEEMLVSLKASGREVGATVVTEAGQAGRALVFRHLGSSRLALCDQVTGNWHCVAEELGSHERHEAYGGSLAAALKAAAQDLGGA